MRLILSFLLVCFATSAHANDLKSPVDISADVLEITQENAMAEFAGNVKVSHENMTLTADKLKVFYDGEGNTDKNKVGGSIRKIEASPKVALNDKAQKITVTGDKADYDVDTKIITITGNVVLMREENVLTGSALTYNLTTGNADIKGQGGKNGRVNASFTPKGL